MSKKTKIITFATTEENNAKIKEMAQEKSWTISQVCHNMVEDYLKQHNSQTVSQEETARRVKDI